MSSCWAVVPAAGRGSRFDDRIPKQYASLAGRTVIEWALAPLLRHSRIRGVFVALAAEDAYWPRLPAAGEARVTAVAGGETRRRSVLNALDALATEAGAGDWVLVHDAARPCLAGDDLDRLISAAGGDEVGAILAVRLTDTVKRADAAGRIRGTVDRQHLWRALTPQMFRLGELAAALGAVRDETDITDEAGAMEAAGRRPLLVPGNPANIKITRREDLGLAELLLRAADRSAV